MGHSLALPAQLVQPSLVGERARSRALVGVEAGAGPAVAPDQQRQRCTLAHERDQDQHEGDQQDQVAFREVGWERQSGGK